MADTETKKGDTGGAWLAYLLSPSCSVSYTAHILQLIPKLTVRT